MLRAKPLVAQEDSSRYATSGSALGMTESLGNYNGLQLLIKNADKITYEERFNFSFYDVSRI